MVKQIIIPLYKEIPYSETQIIMKKFFTYSRWKYFQDKLLNEKSNMQKSMKCIIYSHKTQKEKKKEKKKNMHLLL